jgi:hypothetical protein
MNDSVSIDQLIHIIGMKEVEIILHKAKIAELTAAIENSKQKEDTQN